MRILITGASGYIGRHVVKECLDHGHEVIACDIDFKDIDERAKYIKCDIFEKSGDTDIYNELGAPDVLIHLAWKNGFNHNSYDHIDYLPSHVRFIKNMVSGGLNYLSVMGSMHEIGYWEGEINDDTPCNPKSMYGVAKNALRQILFSSLDLKKVSFHWLRAFYIVGDDINNKSIFSKLMQAANRGDKEFPFTSGKNKYDFIDIYLLAKMIYFASIQGDVNGIINICSGYPVSLSEKVSEFINKNSLNIKLNYGQFPDRPYDSPIIYGSAKKISKIMEQHC